jgi:predicted XRE-type DNA-binding protein
MFERCKNKIMNEKSKKSEARSDQERQKFKEFLKKVEDPNYQREINRALPPNATALQVAKYKLCKQMLGYKLDNNLTRDQVAEKIQLSKAETEDILFCEIEKFTLDRLVVYASRLFAPQKLEFSIQPDKSSYAQIV